MKQILIQIEFNEEQQKEEIVTTVKGMESVETIGFLEIAKKQQLDTFKTRIENEQ